jgi:hypothetical protein
VNDLAIYDSQLPANIDVLSRFVLIGTEKLKAIKAEIRAINKADLARDVYDQKLKEQEILSGLILDASTKLGEFTVTIPKATAGRKEINLLPQGNKFKTKEQTANELGFSRKQVHQFETLAKNKDLVEQEKAKEMALKVLKLLHDEECSRDEASLVLAMAMRNIAHQLENARKAALSAKVAYDNPMNEQKRACLMIPQQEIEWLYRVEKVLGLPENRLVRARIREYAWATEDLFPIGKREETIEKGDS